MISTPAIRATGLHKTFRSNEGSTVVAVEIVGMTPRQAVEAGRVSAADRRLAPVR